MLSAGLGAGSGMRGAGPAGVTARPPRPDVRPRPQLEAAAPRHHPAGAPGDGGGPAPRTPPTLGTPAPFASYSPAPLVPTPPPTLRPEPPHPGSPPCPLQCSSGCSRAPVGPRLEVRLIGSCQLTLLPGEASLTARASPRSEHKAVFSQESITVDLQARGLLPVGKFGVRDGAGGSCGAGTPLGQHLGNVVGARRGPTHCGEPAHLPRRLLSFYDEQGLAVPLCLAVKEMKSLSKGLLCTKQSSPGHAAALQRS